MDMNYNNTIDIILSDIEDVRKLIQGFKNKKSIPKIEIDIALEKLRKLYDVLLLFNNDENNSSEFQSEEWEKQALKDIKQEIVPDIKEKLIVDEDEEEVVREENPVNVELINEEKENEIEMLADRYQAAPSRNERVAEKGEMRDISSRLKLKPIEDIKKAIGINDKFLYTKELFKSNPSLYNQTLEVLNSFSSIEEAEEYLESNFNWDFENENVIRFIEVVKRKYPAV